EPRRYSLRLDVQHLPNPRPCTGTGTVTVSEVVKKHNSRGRDDKPAHRQPNRSGGHGHGCSQAPDHSKEAPGELESTRRSHHREFHSNEPQPACQQESRQGRGSAANCEIEGSSSRKEKEKWSTEMRDPTRKEQSRPCLRQAFWVPREIGKEVACVVDSHQRHDGPAYQVDRWNTSSRYYG